MGDLLVKIIQKILGFNFIDFSISLMFKILISVFYLILGKILINILNRILKKSFEVNLKISERKKETLINISRSFIKYIIYIIVICNILTTFGIDITSLITIAGVGSVAVGLGSQSLIQDIITGMFILFEDQYGVGDFICIDNFSGTVEEITLRTTNIRSVDGDLYIIPNGQIKFITNMSKEFNRATVIIPISYEENIDIVIKIIQNELNIIYNEGVLNGLMSCPEVLGIVELAESAINIKITADVKVGENWNVERELRRYIKNRFDKENISMPYPRRVVEILDKSR